MSDSDSSQSYPRYLSYIAHFRQHLAQVQEHLVGNSGLPSTPSYIPPTGYWTSTEKDAFFHALCVYSRLRPDLIAACVKTKTPLDVCTYLEALESASRRRPVGSQSLRNHLEGAMEVSDSWIQWEEEVSASLVALEASHDDKATERARALELETKKADIQRSLSDQSETAAYDYETWRFETESRWSQEDVLRRLGWDHLHIVDAVLQVGESENEITTEICHDTSAEVGLRMSVPEPSRHTSHIPNFAVDNSILDPAICSLPPASSNQLLGIALPEIGPVPQHIPPSLQLLPSLPSQDSLTTSATTQLLVTPQSSNENLATPTLNLDDIDDTGSDLSPASRTHNESRIGTGHKRAREEGGDEVNMAFETHHPNKKRKIETSEPAPKPYVTAKEVGEERDAGVNAGEEAVMAIDTNGVPPSAPGPPLDQSHTDRGQSDDLADHTKGPHRRWGKKLTKSQKIRILFTERGINATTLLQGGLGLFHMSALRNLMRLYKSNDDTRAPVNSVSISADTIRMLNAILIEFTTEAVHRSIISREHDRKLKGKTKVWGRTAQDSNVVLANVEHALEVMGRRGITKDKYPGESLGKRNAERREGTEVGDEDDHEGGRSGDESGGGYPDGGTDNGEDDNDGPVSFLRALPLHRELYPPLLLLPLDLAPSSFSGGLGLESTSLMPIDTDEDELTEELEQEFDLDQQDMDVERDYEAHLWGRAADGDNLQ